MSFECVMMGNILVIKLRCKRQHVLFDTKQDGCFYVYTTNLIV